MDLSRREPGQLLQRPRLLEARPEAFVKPFVIRVSGDAEEARLLGDRFAGNLGQNVSHRQLQLLMHLAQETLPTGVRHHGDQLLDQLQCRHADVSLRIG
jgi:hypothetical protein